MLRISRKAEYGLLALRELAAGSTDSAPRTARALAARLAAPPELFSKVLQRLARAGLVVSVKGSRGGYGLARPASTITLADLVRAVDGPVAVVDCLGEPDACDRRETCDLQEPLERLNGRLGELLESVTLDGFGRSDPSPVELG